LTHERSRIRLCSDGGAPIEQFLERREAVFRQELRKNKKIEHFHDSRKNGNTLDCGHINNTKPGSAP
jgi:hypothetical protein